MDVVELLARTPRSGLALVEICTRLDISRATGHAILATLRAGQWVVRGDDLRYRIGPALPALFSHDSLARDFRAPLRDLARRLGMPVFLTERDDRALIVRLVAPGDNGGGTGAIEEGLSLPFVVPFGREFVAWSDDAARRAWLEPAGSMPATQADRIGVALQDIRRRGYGVERLSRAYLRVYRAMQALAVDSEHDEISTRLAAAFADLATIDVTEDELSAPADYVIATVSAPLRDEQGQVRLSVSAQPQTPINGERIRQLGAELSAFAASCAPLTSAKSR